MLVAKHRDSLLSWASHSEASRPPSLSRAVTCATSRQSMPRAEARDPSCETEVPQAFSTVGEISPRSLARRRSASPSPVVTCTPVVSSPPDALAASLRAHPGRHLASASPHGPKAVRVTLTPSCGRRVFAELLTSPFPRTFLAGKTRLLDRPKGLSSSRLYMSLPAHLHRSRHGWPRSCDVLSSQGKLGTCLPRGLPPVNHAFLDLFACCVLVSEHSAATT